MAERENRTESCSECAAEEGGCHGGVRMEMIESSRSVNLEVL